jgi:hypothetical protein
MMILPGLQVKEELSEFATGLEMQQVGAKR